MLKAGKRRWRLIHSSAQDAATNMAIDEAILLLHSQHKVPPTLRFYTWKPAALTIGYFQRAHKEVDLSVVEQYGFDFVRRMTGGRAVLHEQELTYSLITSEQMYEKHTVVESYRSLSLGLLYGFRELGLQAEFALPQVALSQKGSAVQRRSAVCFDTPSAYELVVEGRKVAGSAQTRKQGVLLQHGSILLDIDVDILFQLFRYRSEEERNRSKQEFQQKAVAINQLLAAPVTIKQAEEAFRQGFARGLEVELVESELTAEEIELAKQLVQTKYSHPEWNFRR